MNHYTLFWLDGTKEIIGGPTIEDAFMKAGYGAGAIKGLDFYVDGVSNNYIWNNETKKWSPKVKIAE